jgi:hypothetical protein
VAPDDAAAALLAMSFRGRRALPVLDEVPLEPAAGGGLLARGVHVAGSGHAVGSGMRRQNSGDVALHHSADLFMRAAREMEVHSPVVMESEDERK